MIQTSPQKTECKAPVVIEPVEVKKEIVQKVGKDKQDEKTEPSIESTSKVTDVPEDIADSFIVTPDYIQQSKPNLFKSIVI